MVQRRCAVRGRSQCVSDKIKVIRGRRCPRCGHRYPRWRWCPLHDQCDSCCSDLHSEDLALAEAGSRCRGTSCLDGAKACGVADWTDKDHGLVCGDRKVMVDRSSFYKTCSVYSATVGRRCTGAWEEARAHFD